jgi:predicted anti-sigma-YlaC factor YlaD
MGCWRYREALSARLDGEASPVAEEELAAHLASCPACARWLAQAERVTRLARVGPAEAQPDLAEQVLRAAGGPGPGRPRWWRAGRVGLAARWGLFAVGCA